MWSSAILLAEDGDEEPEPKTPVANSTSACVVTDTIEGDYESEDNERNHTYSNTRVVKTSDTTYDDDLYQSDFEIRQTETYDKYDVYQPTQTFYGDREDDENYTYTCTKSDDTPQSYETNKEYGKTRTVTKDSGFRVRNVKGEEDTSFKDTGYKEFQVDGTMNGETFEDEFKSYWVIHVEYRTNYGENEGQAGLSPNSTSHVDQRAIVPVCWKEYGDGEEKICGQNPESDEKIDQTFDPQLTRSTIDFFGPINSNLRDLQGSDQISDDSSDSIETRDGSSTSQQFSRWTRDDSNDSAAGRIYETPFLNVQYYRYDDAHTGEYGTYHHQEYQFSVVNVENHEEEVYSDGIGDLTSITCEIHYYGPFSPRDCTSSIQHTYNTNGFNEGRNTIIEDETNYGSLNGDDYRIPEYEYTHTAGGWTDSDDDDRTVIYVQDVEVVEGSPSSRVIETHEKGESTPDVHRRLDGVEWNTVEETYTNFTEPTCNKTYFPRPSDGFVRNISCTDDLEISYDANDKSDIRSRDNEFDYEHGKDSRIQSYEYIENGYKDREDVRFDYVTDVTIEIEKEETYQDEEYGDYSCEKYYETLDETFNCLDEMYVESDTGQNMDMGNSREIVYNYINNTYEDPSLQTRHYSNRTEITSNNDSQGYSGHRDEFTCDVIWQDDSNKDITFEDDVWTSTVRSTGEEVNYIGEDWTDGYTDVKGNQHQPNAINELYIPNPNSNGFNINCDYPHDEYDNGLPDWSFVEDEYEPAHGEFEFDLIGIDRLDVFDETQDTSHDIEVNNPSRPIKAEPFNGSGSSPTPNAFNDTTYQTGHYYDITTNVVYDDGTAQQVAHSSELNEMSFRLLDENDEWSTTDDTYETNGYNTNVPNTLLDHRLPHEGWNAIRIDVFSESGIPMPSNEENENLNQTYNPVSLWSHEPVNMVIEGPTEVEWGSSHGYQAFLLWDDGSEEDMDGSTTGDDTTPWNNSDSDRYEITESNYTNWDSSENSHNMDDSAGKYAVRFNSVDSDLYYSTLTSSWGDEEKTPTNFEYWDYLHQEIDILVTRDEDESCTQSNVPVPGCDNWNKPDEDYIENEYRNTLFDLYFDVTGVSTGSGY